MHGEFKADYYYYYLFLFVLPSKPVSPPHLFTQMGKTYLGNSGYYPNRYIFAC